MEDQLNQTFFARKEDHSDEHKDWYLVDARNHVLGRMASGIASILKGKHKPEYTPHVDVGDHVIVINSEDIEVTGKKEAQKIYENYSGYPGGKEELPLEKLRENHPERIIERAVTGMLPNTTLGKNMASKLHVFAGSDHPHEAQKPEEINLTEIV